MPFYLHASAFAGTPSDAHGDRHEMASDVILLKEKQDEVVNNAIFLIFNFFFSFKT